MKGESKKRGPRRHHNNHGRQTIKSGNCERTVKAIAKRLGIKYRTKK